MIFTDDFIRDIFKDTDFGEINGDTEKQRKFLYDELQKQLDGYWSGSTSYGIMVNSGLLKDRDGKRLTYLGKDFMKSCEDQKECIREYGHYFRSVKGLDYIDYYRVAELFGPSDPAVEHAFKKLLALGERGAKGEETDSKEVINTLLRREKMREEDKACKLESN